MGSVLERLEPDIRIPYDEDALLSGNPVRQAEYLLELVKTLQELLKQLVTISNYMVDLSDGEAVYIGIKNSSGEYPDGTWRIINVSGALEIQKKISGSFTKIAKHNN